METCNFAERFMRFFVVVEPSTMWLVSLHGDTLYYHSMHASFLGHVTHTTIRYACAIVFFSNI